MDNFVGRSYVKFMNLVSHIIKSLTVPVYVRCLITIVLVWIISSAEFLLSAVKVWVDSETFNHCFLVLPISIYLMWKHRDDVSPLRPEFSLGLYLVLVLCLPVWMLAYSGSINSLGHIASFSMISILIGSALGWKISLRLWFPLLFVVFAVPVGEELVPLFQRITADLSVRMLLLSNVPVFYQGLFISIPEGKFLVAEACSGVRFFVSTVMLGTLYSYLLFNGWQKRLAFVLFSIFLPIFANILRVYGTIMVGHHVGMESAAGTDHLIYGWFFFALVMIFLIFVGNFFSDAPRRKEINATLTPNSAWNNGFSKQTLALYGAFFAAFFSWKLLIDVGASKPNVILVEDLPDYYSVAYETRDWAPRFSRFSLHNSYLDHRGTVAVEVDIIHYDGKDTSAELVYWNNRVYDPEKWTLSSDVSKTVEIDGISVTYTILNVVSNIGRNRSILYWYRAGNLMTSSRVKVKLYGAYNRMRGLAGGGTFMSLSVVGNSVETRIKILDGWMRDNFSDLNKVFE